MRLHEVFFNLSQNFTQDETLLSLRERELLASILRHTKIFANGSRADTDRVETILTYALGETMLQRATTALGSHALETIKQQSTISDSREQTPVRDVASPPPSPATGPHPPAPPSPGPGPRVNVEERPISLGAPAPTPLAPVSRPPANAPASGPHPPSPPAPGPGHIGNVQVSMLSADACVAIQNRPEIRCAECVVLDEFLAPEELLNLTNYALAHETDFQWSEVISPGVAGGVVDPEYRRSRVLMNPGKQGDVVLSRVQATLPCVLKKLDMQPFSISRVETQITASNDGDFFRHHCDNAEEEIATRELTFVYFFHREPKAFEGGELRLHGAYRENGAWFSTGDYRAIVPEQNQMILFRSSLLHEITPVVCPSQAFSDSRFTVNGWLHR